MQLLRDLGPSISPQSAFQFNLGIETLHVRMKEHVANTLKVVEFLESHPAVTWVSYPGHDAHPDKTLADQYLPKGAGAVVVYCIE